MTGEVAARAYGSVIDAAVASENWPLVALCLFLGAATVMVAEENEEAAKYGRAGTCGTAGRPQARSATG